MNLAFGQEDNYGISRVVRRCPTCPTRTAMLAVGHIGEPVKSLSSLVDHKVTNRVHSATVT
jgi:hypothetical protein